MPLPSPFPQTLKEAVWQGIVAILLATRLKDIWGFFKRVWIALRESSATAKIRTAEADKTHAEADDIRAHTAIDTAAMIREMSLTMGQANLLEVQLKEKLASQASIIELQKVEIADLKERSRPVEKENTNPPAA